LITATIIGNLGRDAETRQVGNDSVVSFSVASSRKVKGEDVTTWVRVSLWGKLGTSVAQYLTKGTSVAVSGQLASRTYEKDGKTYHDIEIRGSDLKLLGSKRDSGDGASYGKTGHGGSAKHTAPADDDYAGDQEIPF
jgi:single-strand DNA-binding protein